MIQAVGWLCVFLFCCGCLAAGASVCVDSIRKWQQATTNSAIENAVTRIGRSMVNDSWWFSEEPCAQKLMQVYGKSLSGDKYQSIFQIREEWRQANAKSDPPKSA